MKAETLLDIFEPPDGLVGHSAALVAMSGEENFLEDAMLRFTRLVPRQRAELGVTYAFLMLDGHASTSRQTVFPPRRIPGLHEFQPRQVDAKSLLHAKVALLAFSQSRMGPPSHLRLAVLTANYTYTSAREQLELVWIVDVALNGKAGSEDRVDVAAAGKFVQELLDGRFYRDKQAGLTARLDTLLEVSSSVEPARRNRKPRFIHSLEAPLYGQIRERFRSAIDKPRNLLLCGSGFYEEPSRHAVKPEVLAKLEELGKFTDTFRRVVLVEPDNAGAVGEWAKNGQTEGWEIFRPFDSHFHRRRLHAKFVYAGHLRDGQVSNGCLYLGSGNLSKRGILSHGKMTGGHVETGVVFTVNDRLDGDALVERFFCSCRSKSIREGEWSVNQPGDAPDAQPILDAPPILSAAIKLEPRRLALFWRDDVGSGAHARISWTGRDGFDVIQSQDDVPLNADENPAAISVSDQRGAWTVPVVDDTGRVGWQPKGCDTFADALDALLDFPMRPAEDMDEDEEGEVVEGNTKDAVMGHAQAQQTKHYALHAAAELIESIAALQSALSDPMFNDWLDHLDRMFRASFPKDLIKIWQKHGLNVFMHLKKKELCPSRWSDDQRRRYAEMLDRLAKVWELQ
ncbi:MAG: hypothetical protein HKL99_17405 [Burkholderiales bacterium]|nr:hypothetical protein [Burkholderiales bacterium]